jgi:L-lactate dehydrogenase complex protein LldF
VSIAGPIGSIVNASRDAAKHHSLPYACSLCGSCTDVCPVKIDLHNQLLGWRKEIVTRGLMAPSKRRLMRLAGAVLSRPWLYRLAGGMARTTLRWAPRWMIYNRFNPWGRQRELPPPPRESFRDWYRRTDHERTKTRRSTKKTK